MIPEISEFSYGFALTNELVSWSKLYAAPIFPSLIEEGKAGGGYDVKLQFPGVPLYLQFKRAHCMTRRSASEMSKHKVPLVLPFYRFYVTESGTSNQHAMLLELDDGANQVFYAAPRFHRIREINAAWNSNAVASQSIFVRPLAIGGLDDKMHHVAYDDTATFLCSKPQPVPHLSALDLAHALQEKLSEEKRPLADTLTEFVDRANKAVERAIPRIAERAATAAQKRAYETSLAQLFEPKRVVGSLQQVPSRASESLSAERQQLRDLADKAQTVFDAQLIIIQRSET
jgi:hypothetical protein